MTKYKIKKIVNAVRLTLSMPNFWLSFIIFLFAVASLIISAELNKSGKAFASSVFSNVFAGLVTGFAISILSGTKSVYCAYLEARYQWLEETHKMLLDFINTHHELYSINKLDDEAYSILAYDVGSRANWVNERIIQGTFDKAKWFDPRKFFHKRYGYDSLKMSEILSEFREVLVDADYSIANRKGIIKNFEPIYKTMINLNHKVLDDMKVTNIRLVGAKKSLI